AGAEEDRLMGVGVGLRHAEDPEVHAVHLDAAAAPLALDADRHDDRAARPVVEAVGGGAGVAADHLVADGPGVDAGVGLPPARHGDVGRAVGQALEAVAAGAAVGDLGAVDPVRLADGGRVHDPGAARG